MPYFSDLPYFIPILALVLITIAIKGGTRGKVFIALLLLAIIIGDGWICNTIKHAIQRERPFAALSDVHLLLGKGGSGSMPSSHAANWFAATMVTFLFYRRSWRFMLPLALLVSFSRVYNGVHYPSDVLAGAILGAGYAAALVFGADWLWISIGRRWFPLWWQKMPSLLNAGRGTGNAEKKLSTDTPADLNTHWLRLGYVFIFLLLVLRLFYINSSIIELTEDEAYQWTWSKNLALSYYSKPPLIALVQFLGTYLWGDREFGVRFFSPVISAVFSLLLLRFFSRQVSARVAVTVTLILTATLLLAVGSTLMTIDPLSVLFWMATMLAGWRAIQPDSETRDWLWVGLWMGLGFLSKYTNLFQWICWMVFFVLYPPARKQLRTRGPYLALLINALCLIPVLIWNAQHHWITLEHVSNDGALGKGWNPKTLDFMAAEAVLLNPVSFCAMIFAAIAFWRTQRTALNVFLFSMGAPLFLFYFLFSFHSRVLPNWIAPSIIPLFCLMALYWRTRWAKRWVRITFTVAVVFGIFLNVIGHDTNLIGKILKRPLPAKVDPLRRARAWSGTGNKIGEVRRALEREGTPAFIICDHYGTTGELSFYVPEAKTLVGTGKPLVYFLAKDHPENQYFFWPNYLSRTGENAIFVQTVEEPKLVEGWLWKWLTGDVNLIRPNLPIPLPPPPLLQKQFSSVKDLGIFKIEYRGRMFRHVQLFECRDLLKESAPTSTQ
ncbi:MAG: Undecaprenyl phosphate-alpha-4-amino-4-deoxy-L-arabinose arabinosyl transferase [Verrucomicrobiales bacterium]|nr:Undecaprenyl phosphate-alpha-4-amino-4-deoxy-L-arabinose arabinosyl transferase [Verrucomicrobiales bacterium]